MEKFFLDLRSFLSESVYNPADYFLYDADKPLLFSSSTFFVLFFAFFIVYSLIYKKKTVRTVFVCAFSMFFYYKAGGILFLLLAAVTICNFFFAQIISFSNIKIVRKLFLFLYAAANLIVLGYFKYCGFLFSNINNFFETQFSAPDVILPIGISFYIFQAVSYCADVYKKEIEVENNFLDFMFYLTFFPQLVAGPIVRAKDFLPQIKNTPKISDMDVGGGIFLIICGLFKKTVISDFISLNFVDRVFASPDTYTSLENLIAVYGYTLQIYCDFSGYSDMAIGLAQILGYKLPVNFNAPFKSKSVSEFWRRWHISLSTWLRDYIYIPLGGNRKGNIRTCFNLTTVMLLGGLWHGANWKFAMWGAMHGAALCIEKIFCNIFNIKKREIVDKNNVFDFIFTIITFHFIVFSFIFFRAHDFNTAVSILNKINELDFDINQIYAVASSYKYCVFLMFVGFFMHFIPSSVVENIKIRFSFSNIWVKAAAAGLFFRISYVISTSEVTPFIYFQF
jgi:D-alanyl-lipoteichoic acid acyltransferase DltB (MBOAT superfamily)